MNIGSSTDSSFTLFHFNMKFRFLSCCSFTAPQPTIISQFLVSWSQAAACCCELARGDEEKQQFKWRKIPIRIFISLSES